VKGISYLNNKDGTFRGGVVGFVAKVIFLNIWAVTLHFDYNDGLNDINMVLDMLPETIIARN